MNTPRLQTQAARLARTGYDAGWLRLARSIAQKTPPLLDCDDCLTSLPDYIETELNQPFNARDPISDGVRRHLDRCPTCAAAYLDLVEIALWAEEEPTFPRPTFLDVTFLPEPVRGMDG